MAKQSTLFTPEEVNEQMMGSPVVEGKTYMKADEIQQMAGRVIKEKDIHLGPAVVDYLLVYPSISKKKVAVCKKASGELQYYAKAHYILMFSGELWDYMENHLKELVVWHELLHIYPVYDPDKQEWKMQIRDHSFECFWEIYREKGLDWHEKLAKTASAYYNIQLEESGV